MFRQFGEKQPTPAVFALIAGGWIGFLGVGYAYIDQSAQVADYESRIKAMTDAEDAAREAAIKTAASGVAGRAQSLEDRESGGKPQ